MRKTRTPSTEGVNRGWDVLEMGVECGLREEETH